MAEADNGAVLRRAPDRLDRQDVDILIVGGGATGAAIAWDAALRGYTVALIEKGDFAQATSGASSKMIHGGLRYLANLEIGLVREALRERRIWRHAAPHLVTPLPFLIPTSGWIDKLVLRVGLGLYDLLSLSAPKLPFAAPHLPRHSALSRKEAAATEPVLAGIATRGALRYYDCQMHMPERLAWEMLRGAAEAGATILNYAELTAFRQNGRQITGAEFIDRLNGRPHTVNARCIVNATGPWADKLIQLVQIEPNAKAHPPGAPLIRHSKGIHLITRPLSHRHAIAVLDRSAHFFVLPWRGHSLLATTDTPFTGNPDDVRVEEADIALLLDTVNTGLPDARLTRDDVLFGYAGLRPLVADPANPTADTYGASRGSEILDHGAEGGPAGLISAIGGKWTTSRSLAEKVVDRIGMQLDHSPRPCLTAHRLLPGSEPPEHALTETVSLPDDTREFLWQCYGNRMDELLGLIAETPALAAPLTTERPEIGAQIVYAARAEMALTLEDAVFRRTGLCTLGDPGATAIAAAAELMAAALGWDDTHRLAQIKQVEEKLAPFRKTR